MIAFNRNDEDYLDWLQLHPDGYVANVRRKLSPDFVVLHRATCRRISRPLLDPAGYTGRGYRKFCGISLADIAAAPERCGRPRGAFTSWCRFCKP